MPDLIFQHEDKKPLTVSTGADQISWGYGMNVQTYPTYGGEVVQILSTYVDDLQVTGTIMNYQQMERIYSFFLDYIQNATQPGGFDLVPMVMMYPERDWKFYIAPKVLPQFRMATDVVAPIWRIEAAIVRPDPALQQLTQDYILKHLANGETQTELGDFGRLTGGIGFKVDNPFSSPDATVIGKDGVDKALAKVGDWWGTMIPNWLNGDPDKLKTALFGSRPAFLTGSLPGAKSKDTKGNTKTNAKTKAKGGKGK